MISGMAQDGTLGAVLFLALLFGIGALVERYAARRERIVARIQAWKQIKRNYR